MILPVCCKYNTRSTLSLVSFTRLVELTFLSGSLQTFFFSKTCIFFPEALLIGGRSLSELTRDVRFTFVPLPLGLFLPWPLAFVMDPAFERLSAVILEDKSFDNGPPVAIRLLSAEETEEDLANESSSLWKSVDRQFPFNEDPMVTEEGPTDFFDASTVLLSSLRDS